MSDTNLLEQYLQCVRDLQYKYVEKIYRGSIFNSVCFYQKTADKAEL